MSGKVEIYRVRSNNYLALGGELHVCRQRQNDVVISILPGLQDDTLAVVDKEATPRVVVIDPKIFDLECEDGFATGIDGSHSRAYRLGP